MSYYYPPKIRNGNELPEGEHYAIIEFGEIHYPDGYGGTADERLTDYKVFQTKKSWANHIKALTSNRKDFVALIGKKVRVTTQVLVNI